MVALTWNCLAGSDQARVQLQASKSQVWKNRAELPASQPHTQAAAGTDNREEGIQIHKRKANQHQLFAQPSPCAAGCSGMPQTLSKCLLPQQAAYPAPPPAAGSCWPSTPQRQAAASWHPQQRCASWTPQARTVCCLQDKKESSGKSSRSIV